MRKRPISDKERRRKDHDSVSCLHPVVWVHSAKLRVDGITKYLDHNSFCFDYGFGENSSTEDVYRHAAMPLVEFLCCGKGGRATVFAYGQTGKLVQNLVRHSIFFLHVYLMDYLLIHNRIGQNIYNGM